MKELNTARPHPGAGQVSEAQRWAVSDEDVDILRDEVPLVETLLASGQVEGPASVLGLVGSSCNITFRSQVWPGLMNKQSALSDRATIYFLRA